MQRRCGGWLMGAMAMVMALAAVAHPVSVTTAAGTLEGAVHNGVAAYLGVPYAAPPVGAQRWRSPAAVTPWHGVRPARDFGPACYQSAPMPWGPYGAAFLHSLPVSEDCLTLNVWTAGSTAPLRPVLVYIHGGAFSGGSGAIPIYNGEALAARGAVVVTVNYRVGVFGFFAHPALTRESMQHTSGNYGLEDMIAALQWVHRNIRAFGGDPAAVTVAGQSAGASAVNDLLLAPAARGLFQRAIAMSGSGMSVDSEPLAVAEQHGLALQAELHVDSLSALRAIPAETLLAATAVKPPAPGSKTTAPSIPYKPNVDRVVLSADPDDGGARAVSRVPLMTGYTSGEAAGFPPAARTAEAFEALVRERYGAVAPQLLAAYPHDDAASVVTALNTLARDRYVSGMVQWSRQRMATGQVVYRYVYDHPFPPEGGVSYGSFHTSEVPYFFGTVARAADRVSATDETVSAQLMAHLLAFLRTGTPSVPGMPWPAARSDDLTVMWLGDTPGMRDGLTAPERYRLYTDYAAAGGHLGLN
jgi:para-nitrobenzyl esterase